MISFADVAKIMQHICNILNKVVIPKPAELKNYILKGNCIRKISAKLPELADSLSTAADLLLFWLTQRKFKSFCIVDRGQFLGNLSLNF